MIKNIPSWTKTALTIIGMIVLIYFLEGWGILGIAIFVLSMVAIRLIKSRHQFMHSIKLMEGTIFGKPLDKEMWEKGELKDLKIKIKWRKKHEKHNTEVKETTNQ